MLYTSIPTPTDTTQHTLHTISEDRSLSMARVLLHIEGLAVFASAIALYMDQGWGWGTFLILLFAPDLAALGYLAGPVVGARVYNLAHFYALPLALGMIGLFADTAILIQFAMIWFAHIGIDRALGYGFKYTTGFKDTHLTRL